MAAPRRNFCFWQNIFKKWQSQAKFLLSAEHFLKLPYDSGSEDETDDSYKYVGCRLADDIHIRKSRYWNGVQKWQPLGEIFAFGRTFFKIAIYDSGSEDETDDICKYVGPAGL